MGLRPQDPRGSSRRRRSPVRASAGALVFAIVIAAGCAAPQPMMLGGRTTPRDRVDLGVGGAARIPLGDLQPPETPDGDEQVLHYAESGGIAPIAWGRWGLADDWDLGLFVSGSVVRLETLGELRLSPFLRLIGGVMPYGGYARADVPEPATMSTRTSEGWRVGALAPIAIGIEAGGVFEGWLGARVGFEHADGSFGPAEMRTSGALTAFRGGLVLGLGLGLRRVHVLIELAADYEYWRGGIGEDDIERHGVALTPGFALRLRL